MKEKFSNYVTGLCKYIDENWTTIAISALPLFVYGMVIAGLMITDYIPVYSLDPSMSFWKKCLWELVVNLPIAAWLVSWMLAFFVKRK